MSKLYEEIIRAIDFTYELCKDSDENVVISNVPIIAKSIEKIAINAQIELLHKLEYAVNPSVSIKEFKKDLKKQLEQ